jgi:WD40 repeat protein
MKTTYLFLLSILGLVACTKFELPLEKSLKNCQAPTGIIATADPTNPKKYTFTLTGITTDIASVTWKITSTATGTTILASIINNNANSYGYTATTEGTYTVTASYITTCVGTGNLSTNYTINTQATVANSFSLTDPMVHSGLSAVAVTNDGTVIANENNLIKIWDYKNKTLLRTITGHINNISSLALSVDEKYLFSSSYGNTILVHDWKTGTLIRTLTGHTSYVYDIAISADNKYLASGSYDNTIKIWNIADGSLVRTINVGYTVYKVSISNDAQYVAARYYNGGMFFKVWNGQTGTEYWGSTINDVYGIVLNPTGTQLWVSRNSTSSIENYAISSKQLINTIPNSVTTNDLAMSIDGKYIYTTGGGNITIDVSTGKPLYGAKNNHYNWSATACAISANNQYACSASSTGSISLCPLLTGDKIANSSVKHPSLVNYGYVSKDKKSLITNDVSSARVWDLATGAEKTSSVSMPIGSGGFSNVGVMSNNLWLKSCGIEQHSLSTGAVTQAIISNGTTCGNAIAVSPDDKLIAIAGSSATIQLRDATNGSLIRTLPYTNTTTQTNIFDNYLEFTPDNKYLISCNGADKVARVWDIATGNLVKPIANTFSNIDGGTLSADGTMVALADYQKVEIYNITTGALVNSIVHNNSISYGVAFSPDGKNIAVGGNNLNVKIFNIATAALQKTSNVANIVRNIYYNSTGTQLYVITEKDFQVLNVQ